MSISLIIPTLQHKPHKATLLGNCIESMKGYDEIIVIADPVLPLPTKINMGLSKATGDFLVVSNDDLTLVKGTLKDLAEPDCVTSPTINGHKQDQGFSGHIWCVPRDVFLKVGYLDQGYKWGYYDDEDYFMRIQEERIPTKCKMEVDVSHPIGGTTLHDNPEHKEIAEKNRIRFERRWLR